MLIRSLIVNKYGVCRDTEIGDINDELIVVYGPNEAGKTTCMEFIRGVFYGLASDGRQKYVRGNAEDVFGGSISIDSGDGQSWVVTRELSTEDGDGIEKLDILIDGQLHSAATMNRELLQGVDHDIFRNVFTVGLDELQHLNSLNATEAAEFLYEMTTGMDRVSLGEVLRGVTQTRRSIYDPKHDQSDIGLLQIRVEQLEQLIQCDYRQLESWSQLRNEIRSGRQEIDRLADESGATQRKIRLLEIATITRDMWIQRRESLRQLNDRPDLNENLVKIVGPESVQRLRALEEERGSLNQELLKLSEQVNEISAQIDSVSVNTDVAANVVRIHAVCEHASWLASLQDQVASLKTDVVELNNQGQFELSNGLMDRIIGPIPEVDYHVIRSLSQAEGELTFALERREEQALLVDQVQVEFRNIEKAWMDLVVANSPQLIYDAERALDSSKVGFDEIAFETLLGALGSKLGVLRNRLVLDDQQQRLLREMAATDVFISEKIGGLPDARVLGASAGLTIIGFVGAVIGFAFPTPFSLGAVAAMWSGLLGSMLLVAGIGFRVLDSLRRKQLLTKGLSRQSLLSQQNAKCRDDIQAIELKNDLSGAALDIQLREIQEQHSVLESMVPVLGKFKSAKARLQLSRTRLSDSQHNVDEAEKTWARVLVEQGLPEALLPCDVHAIADNLDVIAQGKRRLDDRKAELKRRKADLDDLVNRIEQLLLDVDSQPQSTDPAQQIRQLNQLLNELREAKQQRKVLKKSVRKLKKRRNKVIAKRVDLETSLNRVFVQAGVSDLAELEKLAQSHCGSLELKRRCDEANEAILQQLNDKDFDENELFSLLEKYSSSELLDETQRLSGSLSNGSQLLSTLHEKQGQKKQELHQLLSDSSLEVSKLELAVAQQQLADAQRRWRVWAVTEFVLQQVRCVYESDRQPETLVDAGHWISKISNGKYNRIWTPLDEDALYVDDASGQTWGIDMLSRGTRESVFICLRLALVNSYTRRGIRLPLILDDVLVNCDTERAKHGVAMLSDFAEQGTQVFFFTCHGHLTDNFESANADVRQLALREDVVAPEIPQFSSVPTDNDVPSFTDEHDSVGVESQCSLPLVDVGQYSVLVENVGKNEDAAQGMFKERASEFVLKNDVQAGSGSLSDIIAEGEVEQGEVEQGEVEQGEVEQGEVEQGEVEQGEVEQEVFATDVLSTEQEIDVVDRLVETVAVEMEQIDSNMATDTTMQNRSSTRKEIDDVGERSRGESRYREDDEYDEIEIIDEDEFGIEMIDRDDREIAVDDQDWDVDSEEEDDLAA
jgi:uncharacterized protein YhaN